MARTLTRTYHRIATNTHNKKAETNKDVPTATATKTNVAVGSKRRLPNNKEDSKNSSNGPHPLLLAMNSIAAGRHRRATSSKLFVRRVVRIVDANEEESSSSHTYPESPASSLDSTRVHQNNDKVYLEEPAEDLESDHNNNAILKLSYQRQVQQDLAAAAASMARSSSAPNVLEPEDEVRSAMYKMQMQEDLRRATMQLSAVQG